MRTTPSAVTTSASSRLAAASPRPWRSCRSRRSAPARRRRPTCSRRPGRSRRPASSRRRRPATRARRRRPRPRAAAPPCLAALGDERVVHDDGLHPPGPDEQRVGGVRRALVAVAAALDDQAQVVLAREVDRGDDIGGVARGDRVDARLRRPGIDPAEGLGEPGSSPRKYGFDAAREQSRAGRAVGRARQSANGDRTLIKASPSSRPSARQRASSGQPASPGRTRDARRVGGESSQAATRARREVPAAARRHSAGGAFWRRQRASSAVSSAQRRIRSARPFGVP